MAKIATQNLKIVISKIVRTDDNTDLNVVSAEIASALETVLTDLLNDDTLIVEVFGE